MMKHSPYFEAETAASYDRLAVPHHFAAPARDLVRRLRLPVRGLVLDVGSGSGAAAIPAAEIVGPQGVVVALDPSLEMLRLLQRKGGCWIVAGQAPGLPFPDDLFHAVIANFVLSHFKSYKVGLADVIRVLRSGGRLGVTAWGATQNEFVRVWKEVAAEFVSEERFQHAFRELIPWDEWFSQDGHLQEALEEVGLLGVEVSRRQYRITMSATDFLSVREISVEGRLLRRMLKAGQWHEFQRRLNDLFRTRFGESIEYT